ncbi:MAG TPA: hypothetical protein VIG47_01240 [Gemmatimonadaceae bacterium]|jgi:hypothetical protein
MVRRRPAFSTPDIGGRDEDEAEDYGAYLPAIPMPAAPNLVLTQDVAEQLISLVQQGMMIEDAGNMLMIHPKTMRSWINAGDADPTSAYGWFAFRIRRAQAIFSQEMVQNVRRNAKNDGNVALKTLEKVAAGDWRPATNTHEVKGTIVHEHIGAQLAEIVAARKQKKLAEATEADVDEQPPVQGEYREEVEAP